MDAGSCNGCELEIHAVNNPYYNLEGLGIRFVASPRHADMLLVTGPVSRHMAEALRRTCDATPAPKLVVAVGDCGCTGGIFGQSYASCGRVAEVIPVDVAVPGCPPPPIEILRGILTAVTRADDGTGGAGRSSRRSRRVRVRSAKGHRIVAELAERQLTPEARAEVRALLQEEASPHLVLIAPWADQVRDLPRHRKTARLHFINFSRADPCHYVAERDCPDGECIVAAIDHYRRILRDRSAPHSARSEALKFVVHFVADIHQPLHSAFGDDRGANTFQVRYGFQGLNLHALFDRVLLESRPFLADEYADFLQSDLPSAGRVTGTNPAVRWAESACRLVASERIYPPRHRVEEAYVLRMRPVAERQLQLAGVRLAAVLNADLGAP